VCGDQAREAEVETMQVETGSVAATQLEGRVMPLARILGALPFSGNEDEEADGKEGDEVMGEPSEEAVGGKADGGPAAERRRTQGPPQLAPC
jgi:hypothetical protein